MIKKIEEIFFRSLMLISNMLILFVLALILFSIFKKGLSALNWEMLTQRPHGGYYYGKEGGVLNAIVGSL
jgi:phosphate transport system permease protein